MCKKKKLNKTRTIWIKKINQINKYPSIFIANEFFDALPIKQFEKKKKEWFEKFINLNNPKKALYLIEK